MSAHFWGKRIFLQFSYILIKGLSSQIASYYYLIHILLALRARVQNLKDQTMVDTENLEKKFMFPLSVFLTWEKTKKMPIAAVGSTKLQGSVFVFLNQIAVKLGR